MNNKAKNSIEKDITIKQKILVCSLDLFAMKGYAETSIRDIAKSVGSNIGTIYSYFSSKEDILVCMLNDYYEYTKNMYFRQDLMAILKNNPTSEGVASCIITSISVLTSNEFYLKLFHLVHVEQHRIDLFGNFLLKRFNETTEFVERIIEVLKALNIVNDKINAEYWGVTIFSLLYSLSNCIAIQTRQNSQGYTNKDISNIVHYMSEVMLNTYKCEPTNITD